MERVPPIYTGPCFCEGTIGESRAMAAAFAGAVEDVGIPWRLRLREGAVTAVDTRHNHRHSTTRLCLPLTY